MTYREAITIVLRDAGRPMRAREIADEIERQGLYRRRDGSPIPPTDVNVCANDNKQWFDVDRGVISLRDTTAEPAPIVRPPVPPIAVPAVAHDPVPSGLSREIGAAFLAGLLDLTARPGAPVAGWGGVPEIAVTESLRSGGASDRALRLLLTFTASMDRARDADRLWYSAQRMHEAAPWTFDPQAVVDARLSALADVLRTHQVSQRHGPDAAAWRMIAEALADDAEPAVSAAINEGAGDARVLLAALNSETAHGIARFPFLRGPKVGPMWVRMLAYPGGAEISHLDGVPVAVDVQVRRFTENLGVTATRGLGLDEARPVIQAAWQREVARDGAPGPAPLADTAAALDPALWFWGKWGCTRCEQEGGRLPIADPCRHCRLPERGAATAQGSSPAVPPDLANGESRAP